jgi:hypothetical protein
MSPPDNSPTITNQGKRITPHMGMSPHIFSTICHVITVNNMLPFQSDAATDDDVVPKN